MGLWEMQFDASRPPPTRSWAAWSQTPLTSAANSSPPWPRSRGVPGLKQAQLGVLSMEKLGEDSSKGIRLLYVRGVPAVGEDLLAVASVSRRVLLE
jgi:hypothetical protein